MEKLTVLDCKVSTPHERIDPCYKTYRPNSYIRINEAFIAFFHLTVHNLTKYNLMYVMRLDIHEDSQPSRTGLDIQS